jgi:hypothetical protein
MWRGRIVSTPHSNAARRLVASLARWLARAVWLWVALLLTAVSFHLLVIFLADLRYPLAGDTPLAADPAAVVVTNDATPAVAIGAAADDLARYLNPAKPLSGFRTLFVRLERRRLTVRYELSLPENTPLFRAVQRGEGAAEPDGFVQAVLGAITVDGSKVSFERPAVAVTNSAATITLVGKPVAIDPSRTHKVETSKPTAKGACCQKGSKVVAELPDMQVVPAYGEPLPIEQRPGRTIFKLKPGSCCVAFDVVSSKAVELTPLQRLRRLLGHVLSVPDLPGLRRALAWAARLYLPALNEALFWVSISLPWIVFLVWWRRGRIRTPEHAQRLAKITPLMIGFYAGFLAIDAFSAAVRRWGPPARPVVDRLVEHGYLPRNDLIVAFTDNASHSRDGVLALAALIIWPVAVQRWQGGRPWARRGSRAWIVHPLLWLGTPIIVLAVQGDLFSWQIMAGRALPPDRQPLVLAALTSLVLFGAIAALIWQTWPERPPWKLALPSTLLLINLALVDVLADVSLPVTSAAVQGGLAWAGAVFLLGPFLGAAMYTLGGEPARASLERLPWLRWGLLVLIGVIALPTGDSTILDAAEWLDYLAYFLILIAILASLRRLANPNRGGLWSPFEVGYLGALVALSFLYDPVNRFFYVPVSFVLGYLLFRYWLFPKDQVSQMIAIRDLGWSRGQMLEAMMEGRRANRAVKAFRKQLLARVSKGELPHAEYREELAKFEASTSVAPLTMLGGERTTVAHTHPIARLGMGLGPSDSPWSNAKFAALCSGLLSLIWILREGWSAFIPGDFAVLGTVALLGWVVAQWLVLGFLLGYFYPYVRGRNGVRKGLYMAVAVILPNLVTQALRVLAKEESWSGFLPWAISISATCLLVSVVAGDLRTLWMARFRVWHIMDLTNLRVVLTRGASIVAAVVAALTAALNTPLGKYFFERLSEGPPK